MVRGYLLVAIGMCLGIVAGQRMMIYAYDPDTLEKVTLVYATEAAYEGCMTNGGTHEKCYPIAQKFYNDTKDIWHNKVWRKY